MQSPPKAIALGHASAEDAEALPEASVSSPVQAPPDAEVVQEAMGSSPLLQAPPGAPEASASDVLQAPLADAEIVPEAPPGAPEASVSSPVLQAAPADANPASASAAPAAEPRQRGPTVHQSPDVLHLISPPGCSIRLNGVLVYQLVSPGALLFNNFLVIICLFPPKTCWYQQCSSSVAQFCFKEEFG